MSSRDPAPSVVINPLDRINPARTTDPAVLAALKWRLETGRIGGIIAKHPIVEELSLSQKDFERFCRLDGTDHARNRWNDANGLVIANPCILGHFRDETSVTRSTRNEHGGLAFPGIDSAVDEWGVLDTRDVVGEKSPPEVIQPV